MTMVDGSRRAGGLGREKGTRTELPIGALSENAAVY
jgi:hypothetical protein